ncbi:MAG: hypothetical protein ACJ71K_08885 [Nitrososphaeraceae archaeon]
MEIEHSIKDYFSYAFSEMYSRIIMIKRVCSYCRSITCYDNYKESNGYWYSSITRDNKRSLYFLCSNCYAKQTDKNTEWNPINNAKRQKGKRLDIKQKISIIIRSITDSIFDVDYIH